MEHASKEGVLEGAIKQAQERMEEAIKAIENRDEAIKRVTEELNICRDGKGLFDMRALLLKLGEERDKLKMDIDKMKVLERDMIEEVNLLVSILGTMVTTLDGVAQIGLAREVEAETEIEEIIKEFTDPEGPMEKLGKLIENSKTDEK